VRRDFLTIKQRSELMARVRSRDTSPEIRVRQLIHSMGYRFRIHRKDLPGQPDLVFLRLQKVIFVHGCFWHGHKCLAGLNRPKSNVSYWGPKLDRNKIRDREHSVRLKKMGWGVLVIWECRLRNLKLLAGRIKIFLGGNSSVRKKRGKQKY